MMVPSHRLDSGFDIYAKLEVKMAVNGEYSCTDNRQRPAEGYCVRLMDMKPDPKFLAQDTYKLEVEIPHYREVSNHEFYRIRFSFLALFNFIRTAAHDADAAILLSVAGFWYNQIPFSKSVSSLPPSRRLVEIASKVANKAGLSTSEESISYGSLTWRVQRQFAGYAGPAERMNKYPDEGGFIVGCQFTELATKLRNLTAAEPYSRFKFLIVSDVFSAVGRAVGKADSTFGPTDRIVLLVKQALTRVVGDFVLLSEVLGGEKDLDSAFGVAGLNHIYRKDPRGARQSGAWRSAPALVAHPPPPCPPI